MRLHDRSRKPLLSCLCFLGLQLPSLLMGTPAAAQEGASVRPGPQSVQLSVGPWALMEQDLRDALGTGFAAELAYAAKLRVDRGPWLDVSLGFEKSSGPIVTPDPTFEVDDSELTVIPFSIGIRGLVAPESEGAPVRVYAGLGATWAGLRWDTHFEETESNSTFGGYAELRPELQLTPKLHLWLRQRLTILADSRFDDSSIELNASGLMFSAGLRFDLSGGAR
ncbi:MAG: hypothetical protein R3E97_05130 [Candidatus Eisenbacteria bacterium]